MPNRIDRIVPNPHVYLSTDILKDKPDLAILVTQIFAVWARIEHELSFLLVRVLGANAAPAIAMYGTLIAQHLQLGALEAAAKAALTQHDFEVFQAAIAVTESIRTPRNQLAHWAWAGCKQRPDLLALANPKMIRERDFRVAKILQTAPSPRLVDVMEVAEKLLFDVSEVIAYSKADLERALRDMNEGYGVLVALTHYLDPTWTEHLSLHFPSVQADRNSIRAAALAELDQQRLFREALARIRGAQKSTPPPNDESHQLGPDE
jgi:hypothetical protein